MCATLGATPATVALLDGKIRIGLSDEELVRLADADSTLKVSHRDFATAIVKKANGGTTVAGTMFAANMVGIKVFATGGIGGVHKESSFDISTDLHALAEYSHDRRLRRGKSNFRFARHARIS